VLTAAALASTPPAKKCRPGSAAAACLKVGQACAAKKGAAYRKAGFHCVAGRLRKLAPSKTTTARPPATTTTAETTTTTEAPSLPPAGHYAGTTGQGHSIAFDVRADGKNLTNIVGGAVDETCTPSRTWTFPGFETGGFDYPVSLRRHLPPQRGEPQHGRRYLLLDEDHDVRQLGRGSGAGDVRGHVDLHRPGHVVRVRGLRRVDGSPLLIGRRAVALRDEVSAIIGVWRHGRWFGRHGHSRS